MHSPTQLMEPEGVASLLPMMHSGRLDAGSSREPDITGGGLASSQQREPSLSAVQWAFGAADTMEVPARLTGLPPRV